MFSSSTALFATSPIIQHTIAESVGNASTLAPTLSGSMICLGVGLGAILGDTVPGFTLIAWTGFTGCVTVLIAIFSSETLPTKLNCKLLKLHKDDTHTSFLRRAYDGLDRPALPLFPSRVESESPPLH